jgi:nucleolar GTP-binding protein
MNVLYDKDHYKIALGQVSKARNIVVNIAKDYVRMLKYADSLYRCKMLKKTALGRMCTVIKKLNASFGYLEEVRKHLARLPSIDPTTRTLIITGFPNVGKSSLMNNLTNAKVDVQPYPFTTQNLFVGHTVYKYVPWQVIDTPGLLDHPLEQRNTIEMQAVTALAHLNACILYVIDISETCGYFIDQQISLFHSIKPLFKNKPMVVALSKMDLKKWDDLSADTQQKIQEIGKEQNAYIISMSNKSGEGVKDVKAKACDILLDFRLASKSDNAGKLEAISNRLHMAMPKKRDEKERPVQIPEAVVTRRQQMEQGVIEEKKTRKTFKEQQEENGGAGVFTYALEEHFLLENEDWKYDAAPEFFEGKNVADYIDPEIEQKLAVLEKEEAILEQMEGMEEPIGEEEKALKAEYQKVQGKKGVIKEHHHMKLHDRVHKKAKKIAGVKADFEKRGFDATSVEQAVGKRASLVEQVKKRQRPDANENMEDIEGGSGVNLKRKAMVKREGLTVERAEGQDVKKSVIFIVFVRMM